MSRPTCTACGSDNVTSVSGKEDFHLYTAKHVCNYCGNVFYKNRRKINNQFQLKKLSPRTGVWK